jgi:hypothetical protein
MEIFGVKKKGSIDSVRDRNLVRGNSFEVFIKEGGKFVKRGYPMSRNEALDFGSEIVDKTPSASFKIVSSDKRAIPNTKVTLGYFSQNLPKFRVIRMKKRGGIPAEQEFVEREGFRIDSEGERSGISRKGIQKRKFRGFLEPRR